MNDEILYRYLRGKATPAEVLRVSVWRRASEGNQRVLDELAALLDSMPPEAAVLHSAAPDPASLVREAEARRASVSSPSVSSRESRAGRGRRRRGRLAALAAALVVAFGLGAAYQVLTDTGSVSAAVVEEFITGREERATVRLVDGTVVRLAPRSRLRVDAWNAVERRVSLDGRAYFAVASDSDRPFGVATRAGDIRVLGTRFEVNTQETAMRLVVVEGRVSLTPPRGDDVLLGRNEVGHVVSGSASVSKQADVGRLVDWVGQFLVFQETPLHEALAEIEKKYGIRTELGDPELGTHTVTALFVDRPLEDVLETLSLVLDTRWVREGDLVRLEP